MEPVLVIHGGAGAHALVSEDGVSVDDILSGVRQSVLRGYQILQQGGHAVDAVQEAVVAMEDNPVFNCGRGSALTREGTVEMDASIMDGRDLSAGGVICVENIRNPIKLARLIKDESDHVLLVADGAKQFAENMGMELVTNEDLVTQKSLNRLRRTDIYVSQVKKEFDKRKQALATEEHDTVGAVAVDRNGNLAYATSTGGIAAKMKGRCGDSAIPGCGGYADNGIGAVSTTGHGESYLKTCLSSYALGKIQSGQTAQKAMENSMDYFVKRVGGYGGIIAVTNTGDIGITFNTEGMSWAYIKNGELHYGLYQNDDFKEAL